MDLLTAALVLIGVLLIHPTINEIWTLFQIVRGLFAPKVDLKQRYGSWAVVTGCTDGIGKAFALELARRGINIVLIGRNPVKLQAVSSEIEATHRVETKTIVADFAKGREIYQGIAQALSTVEVGILVNNVGIQYSYPMFFGELPDQEIWDLLNTNIASYAQMTRIVLPSMLDRNRGAIVNIGSASKYQPLPFMNLYAASKVFIEYFTEALRHEYRSTPITIQGLCPFYVSTKINHFSKDLRRVHLFTPDTDSYAASALDTLGVVDNTSGYWPHRLQVAALSWSPPWLRTFIAGNMYKAMRRDYLKNSPKVTVK